jgi:Winged helix-turn-helix DNA-binding
MGGPSPGGCIYAGAAMADLVDRIRRELDARIEQLRPLVGEFERLERAAAALARAGVRALPGVGPHVAAEPEREPAGRAMRAKPAAGTPPSERRRTALERTPAVADAKPQRRRAAGSPRATPAAGRAAVRPGSGASGGRAAPRGQTQAKILAALGAAPGSSSAAVAAATGIPTNTVAATISRLVKQGRVRRLEQGGYGAVETPAETALSAAAAATPDAAAVADDTAGQRDAHGDRQRDTPVAGDSDGHGNREVV